MGIFILLPKLGAGGPLLLPLARLRPAGSASAGEGAGGVRAVLREGEGFFARSPGIAHPFPQRFYGIPTTEENVPSLQHAQNTYNTPVQCVYKAFSTYCRR